MTICRNPNCGKENPDDLVFCKYCGRRLREPKNYSKLPKQFVVILGGMLVLLLIVKIVFSFGGDSTKVEPNVDKVKQQEQTPVKEKVTTSNDGLNYKFVFVKGEGEVFEVYLHNSDGTTKKITKSSAINRFPSMSPDGKKIAFERIEKDKTNIYVINSDGSGEKKLVEGHGPTWTFDGSEILFYRKDAESISNSLYGIKPNGSGENPKESLQDSFYMAKYSPDGTKVALTKYSIEGWGIYTVGKDFSGRKTLITNDNRTGNPAWSLDNTKVTYQGTTDGKDTGNEIYTVDLNQNVKRLTSNSVSDVSPSFTTDGKIIFTREEADKISLYMINADGTGEKEIMKDAGYASVSLK